MQVAEELRDVVRQQQQQLEAVRHGGDLPTASNKHGIRNRENVNSQSRAGTKLQQLVDEVRAELNCTRPAAAAAALKQTNNNKRSKEQSNEAQLLRAELEGVRMQLERLQRDAQDRNAFVDDQAVAAHRAHELSNKALLEAEIELQASNDAAAELRRKVQVLEEELHGKAARIDDLQTELATAMQQSHKVEKARCDILAQVDILKSDIVEKTSLAELAKQASERATEAAEAAERRAAHAEALAAADRQRRTAAELTVAELEAGMKELQSHTASLTRKTREEVAKLSAHADTLAADLQDAQEASQQAQLEATAARDETSALRKALESANHSIELHRMQVASLQGEVGALTERAQRAEANVGSSLSEAQRSHDVELKALREVLDTVSAAARQRDTQLEQVTSERDRAIAAKQRAVAAAIGPWRDRLSLVTVQLQQAEQKLAATQAAASAEFKQWEAQLKEAHKARNGAQAQLQARVAEAESLRQEVAGLKDKLAAAAVLPNGSDGPVVLNIAVQEPTPAKTAHAEDMTHSEGLLEGEDLARASPATRQVHENIGELKRHHAAQIATLKEQNELLRRRAAAVQKEIDALLEGNAFLWRVGQPLPPPLAEKIEAAEVRHAEEIDNAMAAVKAAGEAKHNENKMRILEKELLAAQDKAAHLNSTVDKLELRSKRYKQEIATLRPQLEEHRERAEAAEAALATARADLADAQDEVEALLTQRLQELVPAQKQQERPASPLKKFTNMVRGGLRRATPHPRKLREEESQQQEHDQDDDAIQQQYVEYTNDGGNELAQQQQDEYDVEYDDAGYDEQQSSDESPGPYSGYQENDEAEWKTLKRWEAVQERKQQQRAQYEQQENDPVNYKLSGHNDGYDEEYDQGEEDWKLQAGQQNDLYVLQGRDGEGQHYYYHE